MPRTPWHWLLALSLSAALTACQTPPPPPPVAAAGLTPAQVQLLQAQGFEDMEGDWTLQAPTKLLFAVDTDHMSAEQESYVLRLAESLRNAGIRTVRVEGHTDDTGTVHYNQQLSERRAQRVAALLVRGGLDEPLVSWRGWGNTKPLPMPAGAQLRRENRRVAIVVPSK